MPKIRLRLRKTETTIYEAETEIEISPETAARFDADPDQLRVWAEFSASMGVDAGAWRHLTTDREITLHSHEMKQT